MTANTITIQQLQKACETDRKACQWALENVVKEWKQSEDQFTPEALFASITAANFQSMNKQKGGPIMICMMLAEAIVRLMHEERSFAA